MGGYAALRYGLDLKARAVLAVGAPTRIARDADSGGFRRTVSNSPLDLGERALDLKQAFVRAELRPKARLAFASANWDDRLHAERMAGVPDVELEAIVGATSHSILPDLIRQKRLQPLLRWLVEGEDNSEGTSPSEVAAPDVGEPAGDTAKALRIYGRFQTNSAVGRSARNLVLALQSAGVSTTAHAIDEDGSETDGHDAPIPRYIACPPACSTTRSAGFGQDDLPESGASAIGRGSSPCFRHGGRASWTMSKKFGCRALLSRGRWPAHRSIRFISSRDRAHLSR